MAIVKWTPFRELESLRDSIDKFFGEGLISFPEISEIAKPVCDVYETDKNVIVEASLPGIKPEEVNIKVGDDKVEVSAEKKEEKEEKKKNYFRKETRYGSFYRSILLPDTVNKDKAEAEIEDGVLKITIPKSKIPAPKILKLKPKKK